jgi:prevent-host-death family protein
MRIPVNQAEPQLDELVTRAQAGEEVILTRNGQDVVKFVVPWKALSRTGRRAIIEEISKLAAAEASPGPSAARSQDYLYDEFGLPK